MTWKRRFQKSAVTTMTNDGSLKYWVNDKMDDGEE